MHDNQEDDPVAKKAWDAIYRQEQEPHPLHEDISKVVDLFKKRKIERVLDLGCGSGRYIIYLVKHGFDVHGIDISEVGIKKTQHKLSTEGSTADLRIGNIYEKLPYPADFFDAIISVKTLHHGRIREIRQLIAEMKRVLKERGLIYIVVPKKRAKKAIPKERQFGIKYIAPRTYVILGGEEQGVPHYSFSKRIIRQEFADFMILDLWFIEELGYCLLGELKNYPRTRS